MAMSPAPRSVPGTEQVLTDAGRMNSEHTNLWDWGGRAEGWVWRLLQSYRCDVRQRQEKGPNMSQVGPSHGDSDIGSGRSRGPAISEWLALHRKLIKQIPTPLPSPDPHSYHMCLFSGHISTTPILCPAFTSHPNDIPGVLSPF